MIADTYKNDIFTGARKYNMITNTDGTVSFTDVTNYTQVGTQLSAGDMNEINSKLKTALYLSGNLLVDVNGTTILDLTKVPRIAD